MTDDIFKRYYNQVGREISLAMDTLHRTQDWAIGTLVLALTGIIISGDYPDLKTMLILLFLSVLLFVFFKRSLLALINLHRWNHFWIKLTQNEFEIEQDNRKIELEKIKEEIEKHHFQFISTVPRNYAVRNILMLGYLPLFVLLLIFISYGFLTISERHLALYVIIAMVIAYLIHDINYIRTDKSYNQERGKVSGLFFVISLIVTTLTSIFLIKNGQALAFQTANINWGLVRFSLTTQDYWSLPFIIYGLIWGMVSSLKGKLRIIPTLISFILVTCVSYQYSSLELFNYHVLNILIFVTIILLIILNQKGPPLWNNFENKCSNWWSQNTPWLNNKKDEGLEKINKKDK